MKEILLANGFSETGLCAVCSGRAMRYFKTYNGKSIEVKVYGKQVNTLQGLRFEERGDAIIIINGRSKLKVTKPEYLQSSLEFHKLTDEKTAA